ncbi:hypothetical protein [Streptomyces gobiensis]|uniref:hypothetical protein n=1 Tax=Streptomyces gobiensis TaxID=2875706 RepID=UPI001E3FE756|nr:hypothetical protein [Streptomyces gobiensis]UGY91493.1 hypothetical protein test1122_07005 [Streptomyces gobiensis]
MRRRGIRISRPVPDGRARAPHPKKRTLLPERRSWWKTALIVLVLLGLAHATEAGEGEVEQPSPWPPSIWRPRSRSGRPSRCIPRWAPRRRMSGRRVHAGARGLPSRTEALLDELMPAWRGQVVDAG